MYISIYLSISIYRVINCWMGWTVLCLYTQIVAPAAGPTITPGPGLHVAEGRVRDPQMLPVETQRAGFKD